MHDDRCLLYLQLYEPLLLLIIVRCRSTYSENGQNNPDKVSLLSGSFTPISSGRPPRRVCLFICGNRRNNNINKACIYSSGSERERERDRENMKMRSFTFRAKSSFQKPTGFDYNCVSAYVEK